MMPMPTARTIGRALMPELEYTTSRKRHDLADVSHAFSLQDFYNEAARKDCPSEEQATKQSPSV